MRRHYVKLYSDESIGEIMSWYGRLNSDHKNAERAQLRRCETVNDIQFQKEFFSLVEALENADGRNDATVSRSDRQKLACLCGLLAHVKDHRGNQRLGRQLAGGPGGKGLTDLRFRKLVSHQTVAELLTPMRRAIQILRGEINVGDLSRAIVNWRPNSEYRDPSHDPRLTLAEEFYTSH